MDTGQEETKSDIVQVLRTHLFDHFTGDGVSISIDGTLCYHYDVEPLAGNVTRRLELGAQMLWPVCFWRPLGNEDVISLADNAGNLIGSTWVKKQCL